MVDIVSTCLLYPNASSGWAETVALRQTLTNRTFRSGPGLSWGSAANSFRTSIGVKPEFLIDAPVGDGTTDTWEQVAGGVIYTDAPTRADADVAISGSAGYQSVFRSGSNMSAAINSILTADATEADKFFVCPQLYAVPTGSSFQTSSRTSYSVWQLIAANGTVSPGITTDHVYESLGRRCRKSMESKGFALNKLMIRWNKEGNRTCAWGWPVGISGATKWPTFIAGWKRVLEAFDRGYGAEARHFFGYARGNSGDGAPPSNDPSQIDTDKIWDALEISWHPAKEITTGVGGTALASGEGIDAVAKPRCYQRYQDHINGVVGGIVYQDAINYCKAQRMPFVCSEGDPSKTNNSFCWVPDWCGQWMYETFTAWDADLRSAGTCLIQAMYSNANLNSTWWLSTTPGSGGSPSDEEVVRSGINAGTAGLPPWYLKEIAVGATNSISLPISDANFAKVKAEWQRRHALWVTNYKSKWS